MAEAILSTLRETWSGYVEGLRLVIPRLPRHAQRGGRRLAHRRARSRVTGRALGWLRVARLAERTGTAELLRKASFPGRAPRRLRHLLGPLPGFLLAALDALWVEDPGGPAVRGRPARAAAPGRSPDPSPWASSSPTSSGESSSSRGERRLAVGAPGGRRRLLPPVDDRRRDGPRPLGLAGRSVLTAFAIVVGAAMLAVAIAVGVGAGPLVRRMLDERLASRSRPDSDGSSHL